MATNPTGGRDASISRSSKTGIASLQERQSQMQTAGRQVLQQAYQDDPIDPTTGFPDSQQLIARLLFPLSHPRDATANPHGDV
jgi:hypothetical protein